MKTTRLLTCEKVTDAHLIKARLANEGIRCYLTNQHFTNLMPVYNNMPGGGIQVIIDIENLDKAQLILKDKLEPNNTKILCQECGSDNIGLGRKKGHIYKIISIIITVISLFAIGDLKHKHHCKDCGAVIN